MAGRSMVKPPLNPAATLAGHHRGCAYRVPRHRSISCGVSFGIRLTLSRLLAPESDTTRWPNEMLTFWTVSWSQVGGLDDVQTCHGTPRTANTVTR